jgi:hypothetical protein
MICRAAIVRMVVDLAATMLDGVHEQDRQPLRAVLHKIHVLGLLVVADYADLDPSAAQCAKIELVCSHGRLVDRAPARTHHLGDSSAMRQDLAWGLTRAPLSPLLIRQQDYAPVVGERGCLFTPRE